MNVHTMEKFARSVYQMIIEYNNHRDAGLTIRQYIKQLIQLNVIDKGDVEEFSIEQMEFTDTVVELRVYPRTSVGFVHYVGYSIEALMHQAKYDCQ